MLSTLQQRNFTVLCVLLCIGVVTLSSITLAQSARTADIWMQGETPQRVSDEASLKEYNKSTELAKVLLGIAITVALLTGVIVPLYYTHGGGQVSYPCLVFPGVAATIMTLGAGFLYTCGYELRDKNINYKNGFLPPFMASLCTVVFTGGAFTGKVLSPPPSTLRW